MTVNKELIRRKAEEAIARGDSALIYSPETILELLDLIEAKDQSASDALTKESSTDQRIEELTTEVARLQYILEPIDQAHERARALGRSVNEWIDYAKALELGVGGAAGKEAAEQRTKNKVLRETIEEMKRQSIPIDKEPYCGKNYSQGLWSRRNWEAWIEDQQSVGIRFLGIQKPVARVINTDTSLPPAIQELDALSELQEGVYELYAKRIEHES